MKQSNNEKRYIPSQLLIEIKKSDYKRKDDLYVIIDMIYRRQSRFKTKLQKTYGYCQIPRMAMKEFITNNQYTSQAIEYLLEKEYIKKNNYYIPEAGISQSYKIRTEWLGKAEAVEIEDKAINKKIKENKMKPRKIRVKNLEPAKREYYKSFGIDLEGATFAAKNQACLAISDLIDEMGISLTDSEIMELVDCVGNFAVNRMKVVHHPSEKGRMLNNIMHRLMIHQSQINSIADGFLFFKRNKTNGRLDSNLTSLPSYLRKYINNDDKLFEIDIKNSQPYFLYSILKEDETVNKEECEKYGNFVINGTLYEFLIPSFEEAGLIRKELDPNVKRNAVKLKLFSIFYSKITSYLKIKQVFASEFPTIMNYINRMNSVKSIVEDEDSPRKGKENSALAIMLQKRESEMILDVVMVELQARGLQPLTIHDSFVCKENDAPTVAYVLQEKCRERFGVAPAVHLNCLFDSKEDIEEFDEDDDYDYGDGFESFLN